MLGSCSGICEEQTGSVVTKMLTVGSGSRAEGFKKLRLVDNSKPKVSLAFCRFVRLFLDKDAPTWQKKA